jgi:flagellar basal-body rod modification protein FlgD
MASSSVIWNHAAASISLAGAHTAANAFSGTGAAAAPTAASSPSSSNSGATISANDFLTLLVTEMQNQDPTATTDPNEYINQLVNVNSLEQLIQINQTLSSAVPAPSGSSTPGSSASTPGSSNLVRSVNQDGAHAPDAAAATPYSSATPLAAVAGSGAPQVSTPVSSGNLTVPSASPSALRVAQALGGRTPKP